MPEVLREGGAMTGHLPHLVLGLAILILVIVLCAWMFHLEREIERELRRKP
jgi:hypothetical protein